MKTSNKTTQLLSALSPKELNVLKNTIKNLKRQKVFNLCVKQYKQSQKICKIKLFKQLYATEELVYSKTTDYLIRNELRLLNNILVNFIVNEQFKSKNKEHYYLKKKLFIQSLLKRNAVDLAEKELAEVFARIEQKSDYPAFYDFFLLWTQLQNKKFVYDEHYFQTIQQMYKKGFQNWFHEINYKTKKLEVFFAFIERTRFQMDNEITAFSNKIKQIDLTLNEKESPALLYFLKYKIKGIESFGKEKIYYSEKALELLPNLKSIFVDKVAEEYALTQSLGVEYMLLGNYEKADKHVSAVLKLENKISKDFFVKGLYNCISIKIYLKNYKESIAIYEKHFDVIKSTNLLPFFRNITTMGYVLLGNIDQAVKNNIIISSSVSFENNVYSRLNLAIIYCIQNNYYLCFNELENVLQSIYYHKQNDSVNAYFIKNMKQYIKIKAKVLTRQQRKMELKKLQTKIDKNLKKIEKKLNGRASIHYLWLQETILKEMM